MASTTNPETITFGPPHSQWHYHRPSKTYDLSRLTPTKAQKFTISTTYGPPDTKISISPALSALIIVDMQNYFLSPRCRDHPLGLKAAENLSMQPDGLLEKCRALGIQVIWLNWGLTDQDLTTMPAAISRSFSRALLASSPPPPALHHSSSNESSYLGLGRDLGDARGRCLMAGSWNAAVYSGLQAHVRPEDVHCAKNRMSGLWDTQQPLWQYLKGKGEGEGEMEGECKGKGKETLLFAGVNTDQCVLGTLTGAYNAGWDCVLVEDCCATTTEGGREVCVGNVANSYGFVVDSKTFAAGMLA